jgi:glycosyltransferase involved in cell wall biosynthesis
VTPDVVWVIPHNWSIPPIARVLLPRGEGCHVTMQDYVDVHGQPQKFGIERCRRMAAVADQLYARSTTRDATSHPMIDDLRARTGKDAAQMLHAGLEAPDFEFLATRVPGNRSSIRIGYAGTILAEDAFELLVSAVRRIQNQVPRRIELHLFGSHSYSARPWFDANWMSEHGNLPEPGLSAKLRECDWGFAPMSLTDGDPRYNRFSFPTKFISYLAAGLPVITVGDPDSSVMAMAARYDVGLCSRAREPETLAAQLQTALADRSPWDRYGKEIIRCASVEFDAERMRRNLYECFAECARRRKKT